MNAIVALAVGLVLNTAVILLLQRRYGPQLCKLVVRTYLATLILRYFLAVVIWFNHTDYAFAMMFWGDSETYDALGAAVARGWSDGAIFSSWTLTLEGQANKGFIYFVAVLYYIFGQNTLLVQIVNGIIGSLVPIVILEIGLILYDERGATRAPFFFVVFLAAQTFE